MNDTPITERPSIVWRDKTMYLHVERYEDNQNVAILVLNEHGERQATATVNIEPLPDDVVYIKDYSENRGMVLALAKYMSVTGEIRFSGHVRIQQFRLGDNFLDAFDLERSANAPQPEDDPVLSDEPDEVEAVPLAEAFPADNAGGVEDDSGPGPDDEATDPADPPPAA